MPVIEFQITLEMSGPIISQDSGAMRWGLDATARRNKKTGLPVFRGTLIRGNLRHAWQRFIDSYPDLRETINPIKWLGSKSSANGEKRDLPQRGRLVFDDEWVCSASTANSRSSTSLNYRVRKDNTTGVVEEGALQQIESGYYAGEKIRCEGRIFAYCEESEEQSLCHWLTKGLGSIDALGAFKGVGFGRVLAASVKKATTTFIFFNQSLPPKSPDFPLYLEITFDRPFCFARPKIPGNSYESEDFVPGRALIGSIAEKLNKLSSAESETFSLLRESLANGEIYCSHAYPALHCPSDPSEETVRSMHLPLSIGLAGREKEITERDFALNESSSPLIAREAPRFSPDWKSDEGSKFSTWPELNRDISVATEIDITTGAAKEENLFCMQVVRPEQQKWLCRVEFNSKESDCEKLRTTLVAQLEQFFASGLDWMGKTEARVTVGLLEKAYSQPLSSYLFPELPAIGQDAGDYLVVSLQSEARLIADYSRLQHTNGHEQLLALYQEAWLDLVETEVVTSKIPLSDIPAHSAAPNVSRDREKPLELVRFFAQQRLVGGNYLYHRFRAPSRGEVSYRPELLTQPGSVFVFKVPRYWQPVIAECVGSWMKYGLPLLKCYQHDTWETTPYLPQNGTGEIVVNLKLHWEDNLDNLSN